MSDTGCPAIAASTAAATSSVAVTELAARRCANRRSPNRAPIRPPAAAPHRNAASATSDAGTDSPPAPASANAEEHHVAGHVGDEHVPEREVADRVDDRR